MLDPGEVEAGEESGKGEAGVLEAQDTVRGSLDLHLQMCGSIMSSLSLGKQSGASREVCGSVLVCG